MDLAECKPSNSTQSKMKIREFHVVPRLPGPLKPLLDLAYNLWWTWNEDAIDLFTRIDPERFAACNHNPIQLLGEADPVQLTKLTQNPSFQAHITRVLEAYQHEMQRPTWFGETQGKPRIAYFCAEFGIHESVPIYSGGLGVLAGDTLKSASDLGIPMVAVGLAYRNGYFLQQIAADGWQSEEYPEYDFTRMPMRLVRGDSGDPLIIQLPIGSRSVGVQVWKVQVGRIPLFLLDTNLPDAEDQDRDICARLYGGDRRHRLEQEVLLGIGGVKALQAMGVEPDLLHMNEGHSTLATIEQVHQLMTREQLSFEEARSLAAAVNIFTTHTPVPAGHDDFDRDLALEYLTPYAEQLGVTVEQLYDLGKTGPIPATAFDDVGYTTQDIEKDDVPAEDPKEDAVSTESTAEPAPEIAEPQAVDRFCMTVVGLRMAKFRNGVSELHGHVSRDMWKHLWPELNVDEIPIAHITNGVHPPTWISPKMRRMFDRELGTDWLDNPGDPESFAKISEIPDSELWSVRNDLRQDLVRVIRSRLQAQALRNGASPIHLRRALNALDPDVLTIGFCRRFATYKRAVLLFHDVERLGSHCRELQASDSGRLRR